MRRASRSKRRAVTIGHGTGGRQEPAKDLLINLCDERAEAFEPGCFSRA